MISMPAVSMAVLTLLALSGCAQGSFARQDAAAAKRGDCAALARQSLHDHGLERGYGPTPVKACNKAAAG